MGQFGEMIVASARRARALPERMLVGIAPENFARKPRFQSGGTPVVIETNHPAWVYGHLGLYPARVLQMLGVDGARLSAPAGFDPLFKDGTACQDDPEGKIYPAMETITSNFFRAYDGAFEAISALDDAAFLAPSEEKVRQAFPVVGGRVNFMLNNHVMMHMGQVSAWRRCMGMPPA